MLSHRKHHPYHTLSPAVFRKVQFLGPSCASSTLLHSVQSSKHHQLTIIYTPMTPNYSCPSRKSPPRYLKSFLLEPLENRIYTHRSRRRTKENPRPIYFP